MLQKLSITNYALISKKIIDFNEIPLEITIEFKKNMLFI